MILSLTTIEAILRFEDIENFLALGAPSDEYHDKASEIQASLEKLDAHEVTRDRLAVLVMETWERAFGPFFEEDREKRKSVLERVVRGILMEHSTSTNLPGVKASAISRALTNRRSIHYLFAFVLQCAFLHVFISIYYLN